MPIERGVPNFLFGCDPEMFITDKDGRHVSAAPFIPGTKEKPYKVPGGAVQVDGMAAEFNIDPVDNFKAWDGNITTVMAALKEFIPSDHSISIIPSVVFDEDVFENATETAKTLGCTPDFNAWTGEMNPPPQLPENPRLRTASGHVHVGWREGADLGDNVHIEHCKDLVKQLDWYLGAWSVHLDKDTERRKLYGKAGAFRPKEYGCEYRVLSNFWITSTERRAQVWNRMQHAITAMRVNYLPEQYHTYNDQIRGYIDASKSNRALESTFRFPLIESWA